MHVIYLAGGIASGKSTVARVMKELGAEVIDLDDLSRQALAPWSPIIPKIVEEFGEDVLRSNGLVDREKLAARAFATMERSVTLEEIELPVIDDLLRMSIAKLRDEETAEREKNPDAPEKIVVVEIPLLDRMRGSFDMADEIVGVLCPLPARRARAIQRGMKPGDFDCRREKQPTDFYIRAHANYVFNNIRPMDVFEQQVRDWWKSREEAGWAPVPRGGVHGDVEKA
ncbi:dephospho-CoA kinase [Olsenella profusa]|uniref:Dephospho-CoA kinase n=1 Tax=Olsenella profusa TaxID=138595 RepID=A0ABS2F3L9_9ACTN|nr:dephospho-CoA kinase [Olsenella profusa]MBM6775423.1 dephospho-CoA kinase [Olsenella profusa]